MLKNLTYKQKFYAVLVGFVLLSLVSYKKTYRQVFYAKKELALVNKKLAKATNSENDLFSLKSDITVLDNVIGGHSSNPTQVQQLIFDFISSKESHVNLVAMEDAHIFSNEEFLIYTNQVELEGSYENLMELLYDVEKNFKSSRVVSNSMYSKKNYTTNTTKLYLKIILQNYEKV